MAPFLQMSILRTLHPLLSLIASSYFFSVRVIFWGWNTLFHHRRVISSPNNELLLISAVEAARLIRLGEIAAIDLIEAYIERIEEVNPILNAVVEDNFEAAREEALKVDDYIDELDKESEEYANLPRTKPLLGIPFCVKDNMFVKGFCVTAGVPARKRSGGVMEEDCESVRRLRSAGAILLALTNVPELALWWETSNNVIGATCNPYDSRRTSGGSSGGECALLSSAGSVIGLGNDVAGSLRIPAAFTGVFGLKPGAEVVPSDGVIPEVKGGYLRQMATAGPMVRYSNDLPVVMRVLAGEECSSNQLRLHEPVNFRAVRIFYMEDIHTLISDHLQKGMRGSVRKAAKYFEKKYDVSTHRVDLLLAHHAFEMFLASFDTADCVKLSEAMSNFDHDTNCWWELAKWTVGMSDHTLPCIAVGIHCTFPLPSKHYLRFVESKRDQLRREVSDLLGEDGLLFFPAFPTSAPFHNQGVLTPFNFVYTALWNALSLPSMVCPLGMDGTGVGALPTSVQIIGAPNSERLLIAAAQDLEEGFGGWTAPRGGRHSRGYY